MACDVDYSDEFGVWWSELTISEQEDTAHCVGLLEKYGINLDFPHSSSVLSSRHGGMRELRFQSGGYAYRVFYAFDPRRAAMLLIGGRKTSDKRFYKEYVPIADKIYDEHLNEINK